MSAAEVAVVKHDFLSQIWDISTTLTEEAMLAASTKANELGFDPDRGLVPLQESLINLLSARAVLEDAIQNKKLIQLPITVQKEILTNLQNVSKSLQGLINGVDEIVNLTNSIESLSTAIWKFGLHNLSDQVLGYQTKLNQLKNQELQIHRAVTELKASQKTAEKATAAAAEIAERETKAAAGLEAVNQTAATANTALEQIKEAENKINAVFSTVQQHEKQSGELLSAIKTANNELLSLDASVRKFYADVDEYRRKINDTGEQASSWLTTSQNNVKKLIDDVSSRIEVAIDSFQQNAAKLSDDLIQKIAADADQGRTKITEATGAAESQISELRKETEATLEKLVRETRDSSETLTAQTAKKVEVIEALFQQHSTETINANRDETKRLLGELDELKGQIKAQIQQATGFALFGAFQARQNQVAYAKRIWAYVIGVLVLVSVSVTFWIAYEAQQYTVHSLAFYVKLSLTVPLAFAISFCTVQYGRERRLEEEYAFKASISVSLNPYRDLVQSILKQDENAEIAKYTDFVIDSVKNVFTPPTDKVFDSEKKPKLSEETLKQAAEVVGTVVKIAKQ